MPRWNNDEKNARDEAIYQSRLEGMGWLQIADRYRVTVTQAMRIVGREP